MPVVDSPPASFVPVKMVRAGSLVAIETLWPWTVPMVSERRQKTAPKRLGNAISLRIWWQREQKVPDASGIREMGLETDEAKGGRPR